VFVVIFFWLELLQVPVAGQKHRQSGTLWHAWLICHFEGFWAGGMLTQLGACVRVRWGQTNEGGTS